MKSATTASTAMPQPSMKMPVWPVATNRVFTPRALSLSTSCSCAVILPTLQSVPDREHDVRRPRPWPGRPPPRASRGDAAHRGSRRPSPSPSPASTGSSPEEGVKAAPELASRIERFAQPRLPLLRQPSARGRDADEDRRRLVGEALLHRGDHRNGAAETRARPATCVPASWRSSTPTTCCGR